jgi:hypothetical protein
MPKEKRLERTSLHFAVRSSLLDILRFLVALSQMPVSNHCGAVARAGRSA